MVRKILLIAIAILVLLTSELKANNLNNAKAYYNKGNYELALPLFEKEYNSL